MNKQTIEASHKIEMILNKLWVDGDISSYQQSRIMKEVNKELNFEDE